MPPHEPPRCAHDVAAEARKTGTQAHLGRLHALCVEKNSELPADDVRRKYKGRVVFLGNNVKDQNWEAALFQDISSCPATMEAAKAADLYGLVLGHSTELSDAEQAYTQSKMGGPAKTWVALPREEWPPGWEGMTNPVCPLVLSLYGHPDSGGYWERHCEKHLRSVGFTDVPVWRSCFWHPRLRLFLVVYVDDFKLSGPSENLAEGWSLLRQGITTDDPTGHGLYLGCLHSVSDRPSPDGSGTVRALEYNMQAFLESCVERYRTLTGATYLRKVTTPFVGDRTGDGYEPDDGRWAPMAASEETPGATHGGAGGVLQPYAAKVLMKVLYAARMARFDLLRAVGALAGCITKWDAACDRRLHRLMCYVHHTLHLRMVGWVGDSLSELRLHLFADADWAGDAVSMKSTSGVFLCVRGPCSSFPLAAVSRKQTSISRSTPEAELVAADMALQKEGIPALSLWELLLGGPQRVIFHEDNQAMIQVCKTGRNPTMRHVERTHKLCIAWMHAQFTEGEFDLLYEETGSQAADIFTKAFDDSVKWAHACSLVNHVDPDVFWPAPAPGRGGAPPGATAGGGAAKRGGGTPSVPAPPRRTLAVRDVHDVAAQGVVGTRICFTPDETSAILADLRSMDWPKQSRTVITGKGTAVGATYEPAGPRLGYSTRKTQKLIRRVNAAILRALGDTPFEWGSLQINCDSVSSVHVDRNNVGPSMIVLFGDFTGGAFRMVDSPDRLERSGEGLMIDGSKPHYSEEFTGNRFSIVAFLHNQTTNLTIKDQSYLRYLGFQFGGHRGPPVSTGGLYEAATVLPGATRRIVEFCCEQDSMMGRASGASKGCEVIRLTIEDDLTSKSGLDKALRAVSDPLLGPNTMLWGSIPCTGGCPWQRINVTRGEATEAKIREHWSVFDSLWENFVKVADRCLSKGGCVSMEWPQQCMYWKLDRVAEFIRTRGLKKASCHGCAYGVKAISGPQMGMLINKPWTIASTSGAVVSTMCRRCTRDHVHAQCGGTHTLATGQYTTDFVHDVHLAFHKHVSHTATRSRRRCRRLRRHDRIRQPLPLRRSSQRACALGRRAPRRTRIGDRRGAPRRLPQGGRALRPGDGWTCARHAGREGGRWTWAWGPRPRGPGSGGPRSSERSGTWGPRPCGSPPSGGGSQGRAWVQRTCGPGTYGSATSAPTAKGRLGGAEATPASGTSGYALGTPANGTPAPGRAG